MSNLLHQALLGNVSTVSLTERGKTEPVSKERRCLCGNILSKWNKNEYCNVCLLERRGDVAYMYRSTIRERSDKADYMWEVYRRNEKNI